LGKGQNITAAAAAAPPPAAIPVVQKPPPPPPVAVPVARPTAAPAKAEQGVESVLGTVWSGVDSDGDRYTFRFLPGGVVDYTSPTGTYPAGGTWQQTGDKVSVEINKGYSKYRGTIRGDWIEGSAVNTAGHKWTYKWQKQGLIRPNRG
jgi:hypothetical protein